MYILSCAAAGAGENGECECILKADLVEIFPRTNINHNLTENFHVIYVTEFFNFLYEMILI